MALNAGSTAIGLLTSFMYFCYFAIPAGKLMVKRFTIIRTFAYTWFLRNISLIPFLFIPFFYFSGHKESALLMLLLGTALFNFFRGAGIIANNPVIGMLAPGKDRNSFIVRTSLIVNTATLFAGVFLTVFLWVSGAAGIHPVNLYNIVAVIGIITGFIASALLLKLPDSELEQRRAARKERKPETAGSAAPSGAFFTHLKDAFKEKNFRVYIFAFFIIQFGISLVRPFIIVYGKAVYSMPDNLIIIFSLCATAGALFEGLLMSLLIDRTGAKPMLIIFTALSLVSLIPAAVSPFTDFKIAALIFLILFSIVSSMGFFAQMDASQAYFFSMIPKDSILNLSMLYFFIQGITGGLGSIIGGRFLDFMEGAGYSNLFAYRIFFSAVILIIGFGMIFQAKILNLGGRYVKETLSIIFSPKDMKALSLLHKLDTNENIENEQKILAELAGLASGEASDRLNEYLQSPRYGVRCSALHALHSLEILTSKNREAVMYELKTGTFTTAAISAKILGHFKIYQAVPGLRQAMESKDYLLAGEAMISLAKLNDGHSQFKISKIIANTENPHVILSGLKAFEIFNSEHSMPAVFDMLRKNNLGAEINDEACLTLASLMGIETDFYYAYNRFKNEAKSSRAVTADLLDESMNKAKKTDYELRTLVLKFMEDPHADARIASKVLEFADKKLGIKSAVLTGVMTDIGLTKKDSFRFLLCCWVSCLIKNPSLIEK